MSSIVLSIGLASYLETTTLLWNTVDLPGDLMGVGLGAAIILTLKLATEYITHQNIMTILSKLRPPPDTIARAN